MDLRGCQIPTDISSILSRQISEQKVTWYQPFIFTDEVVAGTAAVWNAGADKYLCTEDDPAEVQESFRRETLILGDWYRHLTDILVASFPAARTFFDFGCNVGHFGLDLSARGKVYTGIDVPRNQPGKDLLVAITGIDFEFIPAQYSEEVHRIPDFDEERSFDVGIFSVVIMHLTDPHYAMRYFSQKIRHGLFFSSLLAPGDQHHFKARITPYNRSRSLPHTFELVPTEPLAESLLRFSGFPHLYRIPFRPGVDPGHSRQWGCWIAAREPVEPTAIERYGLTYVEDRTDRYADGAPRVVHST